MLTGQVCYIIKIKGMNNSVSINFVKNVIAL
jgi:hypothetical protein